MYSEPRQKSNTKPKFQNVALISGNCIKFLKEKVKISVPTKMFKTENHCKTPYVVDATDSTRYTRKRGLRTLKRTLSLSTLERTLKRTLKKKGGGLIFGVLRYWKDVSVGVE